MVLLLLLLIMVPERFRKGSRRVQVGRSSIMRTLLVVMGAQATWKGFGTVLELFKEPFRMGLRMVYEGFKEVTSMTDPVSNQPANENAQDLDPPLQQPDPVALVEDLYQRNVVGHFQEVIRTAGGPITWLRSRCPNVVAAANGIWTEEELISSLLSQPEAFWVGHQERLRDCARCVEGEAACWQSLEMVPKGQKVRLELVDGKAGELFQNCTRYADFKIAIRLQESGVDRLLSTQKLSSLGELPPEVEKTFVEFLETGARKKRSPKEYSLLIESRKCRPIGVALLRNSIKNFPHAAYKSVHAPSLEREFKNALTTKEKSPLEELLTFDVLLIDEVNGDLLKSKFRKELTWLYERRRDQGLATIITTTVPAKEAFPGVSVLRV